MSSVKYSTLAFLFVIFHSGVASDVKKAVGDEVSFRLNTIVSPVSSIIWKHRNTAGVVIKVIEWDKDDVGDGISVLNPRFQGITTLDKHTGQITIKKLTLDHAGLYTTVVNNREQEQKFTLIVMELVLKPVITIERTDSDPDVVYLRCEYSEKIIWRNSDGETLKGERISPKGEAITVKHEGKPDKSYTCTLKNDVSEETSDPVNERDLFREPVPKPVITIQKNDSNTNVKYLRCEYSGKIIWRNSDGETLNGESISPKGESITVNYEGKPDKFYTCTLKNEVSEETSDPVYERDLFRVKKVKRAVGDTVSFRLESPPSYAVSSIIWKHKNTAGVVVKVIEWDIEDDISITSPRFKDITTLDKQTGEITIMGLRSDHAGLYTIDVNSKEQEQKFSLSLMDPVPKPTIEIERIRDYSKAVYLKCSYREKIIWRNSDGEILKGEAISPIGESLTVKYEGKPDKSYTCTLKNEVSEKTSDPVYETDLFPGESWWG